MTGLVPPAGVMLVGLFNLLLRASINIFFIAGQTMFFKTVGITGLPYVYAAMNIVYIGIQAGAVRHLKGSSGTYLQRLSAVFFAVAAARVFLPLNEAVWAGVGFLLAVMIYELFFNQFFTHWLNEILPIQEGKRHLPFINGCGSLSFIISGVFMRLALSVTDLPTVIAVDTFAFAIAAASFGLVRRRFSERSESADQILKEARQGEPHEPETDGSLGSLGFWLAIFGFLFTISKYWLDYQYSRVINIECGTAEQLASFIAVFTSCTDALVLLTQLAVAGSVMKRFRLTRILLILPVSVGIAAVVTGFTGGFAAVLATQFLFTWIAKSFHHSAIALVIGILPAGPRLRAMSSLGIAASAGSLASAVILMVVQNNLSLATAFTGLAVFLGLMAVCVKPLEIVWQQELGCVLERSAVAATGDRLVAIESLRAWSPAERLRRLGFLLRGNEGERMAALDLLDDVPRASSENILMDILRDEASPKVRAGAVRRLVAHGTPASRWAGADMLASEEADPRVLANLLEGLAELDVGESFLPEIRKCLSHAHHRVRSAAAEALIRLSETSDDIGIALRGLCGMQQSADPLERAAAIAVLGRLQHETFLEELRAGLDDEDDRVAGQAVAALRRLPLAEASQALRNASGKLPKRLADEANAAAESVEMFTCSGISQILEGLEPMERARVVARLGDWRHDSRIYLLIRALQVEPAEIRAALVAAIEKIESHSVRGLMIRAFGQSGNTVIWHVEQVAEGISDLAISDLADIALLLRLMREHGASGDIETLLLPLLDRIERDIVETPPTRAPESDLRFKLAVTVASTRAADSAEVVEALDRALRGDRFTASLSWEYLELQLGKPVAGRLACLMKTAAAVCPPSATIRERTG